MTSAFFVWIAPGASRFVRERVAMARLESLGATVVTEPPENFLLHELGAQDWFVRVVLVDLGNKPVTDADLASLNGLLALHYLNLDGTQVTDAGLNSLADLRRLRHLSLARTQVTDAGMEVVGALPQLNSLCLHGTRVGDRGVSRLTNAEEMATLDVSNTRVSRRAIEALRKRYPELSVWP